MEIAAPSLETTSRHEEAPAGRTGRRRDPVDERRDAIRVERRDRDRAAHAARRAVVEHDAIGRRLVRVHRDGRRRLAARQPRVGRKASGDGEREQARLVRHREGDGDEVGPGADDEREVPARGRQRRILHPDAESVRAFLRRGPGDVPAGAQQHARRQGSGRHAPGVRRCSVERPDRVIDRMPAGSRGKLGRDPHDAERLVDRGDEESDVAARRADVDGAAGGREAIDGLARDVLANGTPPQRPGCPVVGQRGGVPFVGVVRRHSRHDGVPGPVHDDRVRVVFRARVIGHRAPEHRAVAAVVLDHGIVVAGARVQASRHEDVAGGIQGERGAIASSGIPDRQRSPDDRSGRAAEFRRRDSGAVALLENVALRVDRKPRRKAERARRAPED